ncbi:MAG: hypothetical protein JW895_07035 [Thermoleophilaceae bacterium]|nr:hypothetical protein [Thermoleophilaceae bacterium]
MAALTYRPTTVNPFSRRCAICLTALVVALAGCGGDDEDEPAPTPSDATATATETSTAPGEPATETDATEPEDTAPATSPEDQEGGAGDEVPAQSQALLTGRGGRITPRVVRVPAFISVRVELRSADGGPYVLRFGGTTLAVRDEVRSMSHRFDGLRPGAALVGKSATGAGNPVRIEATAEPGP